MVNIEPVVAHPFPVLIVRVILLASVCYFCFASFKRIGILELGSNNNVTQGIGKAHQPFFVNYAKITIKQIVRREIVDIQSPAQDLSLRVDTGNAFRSRFLCKTYWRYAVACTINKPSVRHYCVALFIDKTDGCNAIVRSLSDSIETLSCIAYDLPGMTTRENRVWIAQ